MVKSNCTQVTEFTLTGFTTEPVIQVMFFQMFLLMYLVLSLKCSFCDILGIAECFLLATTAYDHYVAICHPLLYSMVMSPKLCFQMVFGSYLIGLINSMSRTMSIFNLSFCGSIDLYFCDISLLISLSTSDTALNCTLLRTSASFYGISSILVVLSSYIAIFSTVLGIRSTVVRIFYGALFFMYLKLSSENPRGEDKWAVVLYTVVTPMLNPLIYNPRNKEVKEVLRSITKIK